MGRAFMLIVLALVLLAGCRLMGQGTPGSSASGPEATATVAPSASEAPASAAPSGEEAPEACGFPAGAVLQFAGRSTTRALDVQEVPESDDPLSVVPADIYVTRDAFDQGANHGFLVCAIYTGEADGFVEVTTVPETWSPPEP